MIKTFPVLLLLVLPAGIPGQSFTGVLDATDPLWQDTRHFDAYPITLEEGQAATVRMTSEEFDTYLIVRSPGGQELTNDDYESMSVSQLEFIASEAGEWTVMASAFNRDQGGSYTLEVTLGGIAEIETLSGRLDPSDTEAIKGEFYDTHEIEITDDGPFTLELECFGFDGFLVARSPDGETWRNDDADDPSRSRIGPVSGAGTWTIIVTSAYAGGVGAYDLNIIRVP